MVSSARKSQTVVREDKRGTLSVRLNMCRVLGLSDAETGEILAGKSSSVQFSPASMTKVMTLIVACENLTQKDLERKIPFSEEIHEYVKELKL